MKNIFLGFVLTGLCAFSAAAQVYIPPPPPTPNMSSMIWNTYKMNQMGINAIGQAVVNEQMTKNKSGGGRKNAAKTAVAGAKSIYSPKLGFKVSGYSVLAEKIAQMPSQKMSDAEIRQLRQLFDSFWIDYQTTLKDENQRLGMPYDDLATVLTYFISVNYMRLNDIDFIESEKSVAIYSQLAPILLSSQDMSKMSDKDKELIAEVFVVITEMPRLVFQKTGDRKQLKQSALENLEKIFGPNAAKVSITENGIEVNQR